MGKHEDREENRWQEGMSVTETKKYKEETQQVRPAHGNSS